MLKTSLNSKHYQPTGILIHQQNLYVPRTWWYSSRREAQSCKTVSKVKNLPLYYNQFLLPLLTLLSTCQRTVLAYAQVQQAWRDNVCNINLITQVAIQPLVL
jgi:hypothetical protein